MKGDVRLTTAALHAMAKRPDYSQNMSKPPLCEQVLVYNSGSKQGEEKGGPTRSASSSMRSNCSTYSEWSRCTGAIRMSVPEFAWNPAPAMLLLGSDEVHVWRAALDLPIARVASFEQTLAADERTRAGQFHFQRDRTHFIVARGLLRTILGRYLARIHAHCDSALTRMESQASLPNLEVTPACLSTCRTPAHWLCML